MIRYFFDFRDGAELMIDEEGVVLRNMPSVQREAARALCGLAGDSLANFKSSHAHQMAITVRDQSGPVMDVEFSFKITRKK